MFPRASGDVVEVFPTYEDYGIRIEMFGDEVDSIAQIDPVTGRTLKKHDRMPIYPKSHYVLPQGQLMDAIESIREELDEWRGRARGARQAARGEPRAPAHHVRYRDDEGAGILQGH